MVVKLQPDPHTVSVAASASEATRPTVAETATAMMILRRSTAALLAAPEAAATCFKTRHGAPVLTPAAPRLCEIYSGAIRPQRSHAQAWRRDRAIQAPAFG